MFLRRQFRSYVAYNYVFQPTVSPSASPRLNTALGSTEKIVLYVVRFADKPNSAAKRKELLPAHLEWLDKNKDMILVAGSLRPEHDEDPVGGLWVVEAKDKKTIEALFQTDPFWVNDLRQKYEILYWSKAFPERRVPI